MAFLGQVGYTENVSSPHHSSNMVAEPGRHDEMAEGVGEQPVEFVVEDRSLRSIADKSAGGSRSAAWRFITSAEQKDTTEGNEQQAGRVEVELQKICDGILALMDKDLIPSASTGELKVFYFKMNADYYRFLAVMEEVVDVPVVLQKQAPMIREVLKTVEFPQAQYVDEIFDVTQEQIQERIVEEIIDVLVPFVEEEIIEVADHGPQERVQKHTEEHTVDVLVTHDDCDEVIPERSNSVNDVANSEDFPMNVYRETLLQNKILRVIKKNHVTKYLETLTEIAEL